MPIFLLGLIYLMSAPLSPAMGLMIDKWGRNIGFVFGAVLASIVAHLFFALSFVDPLVGIVVLGFGYSLLASALWPIVALIVPENTLGTAYGNLSVFKKTSTFFFSLQMTLNHNHFLLTHF